MFSKGYREVTLLGQNVDSYLWKSEDGSVTVDFPELLERVAAISPLLRVRFATNHPKDISDSLIDVMASHGNICRHIHLPVRVRISIVMISLFLISFLSSSVVPSARFLP